MNILQGLKMALKSIWSNKLRSTLTMLGIIIGVTAVIALVSLGQGTTKEVTEQVESLGTNLLTVSITGRGASTTLHYEEAMNLKELEGVQYLAPYNSQNASVKFGNRSVDVSVTGTNSDYALIRDYEVAQGRFLSQIDLDFYQKVAVVGYSTAQELFGFNSPVGEFILINGTRYKVVGVLAEKGSTAQGSMDDVVILPLTAAERLASSKGVPAIFIQASSPDTIDSVSESVEQEIAKQFRGDPSSFRIFNQQDTLDTMSSITDTLTVTLAGIAAISLLVGGIGIMNIMLVSVTERTREIGIRKAIGAKRRDILVQFLIESMVLSGLGGVLGILLGFGTGQLVSSLMNIPIVYSADTVLTAFGFSVLIGVMFGVFPANKAAKLKPIEALRFN
ncbi:protein of unknown function DUF214 [Paenibacillus algicola]|uniref:ABC transporter permease n=1 Tax=Paenibacillus algicola TaxID=2565926 RepID=A0A4P8XSE2_9BACL|nr:ABC transporter permease [Paenibacillus algicola]QCT03539.1 protein of unknown function DUF214 [Paenibacillus algicola]